MAESQRADAAPTGRQDGARYDGRRYVMPVLVGLAWGTKLEPVDLGLGAHRNRPFGVVSSRVRPAPIGGSVGEGALSGGRGA